MKDHGSLDEYEANQVIGELVHRMIEQLGFTALGAIAKTSFKIDDVEYEISLRKTK